MGKSSCLICGRLSEQIFCADCSEKGWSKTHSIQKFLRDYPGLTTIEVCRELGISLGFIRGLVSAGYVNLDIPKLEDITLPEVKKASGFHTSKKNT